MSVTVAQQQQMQQPGAAPPPPPPGYDQPPPAYNPQPVYQPQQAQQSQQTVIIQQPRMGGVGGYGPSPVTMDCPYCSSHITSSTSKKCGGMLWMVAGIICFIGLFIIPFLWLGCCLIPFCIPSLYDVEHSCPSCQRTLGSYKAGGSL